MYKVLKTFKDLQSGIKYQAGDIFNAEGVSEKRLSDLASTNNKAQMKLIEFIPEEEPSEVIEEAIPEVEEEPVETPQKKKSSRKKKAVEE